MTSPYSQDTLDALLREDLYAFTLKAFEYLEGQPPRPGRHIELFAAEMQLAAEGQTSRLMINAPPRSLKSFVTVVATTAWMLGRRPSFKAMIITHAETLGLTHTEAIRKLLAADWYQRVFQQTRLDPAHNRAGDFKTTAGGHVFARSLEAGVTGHGADWIIIDDPHDAGEVQSAAARQRAYDLVVQKFMSRLNSQAEGVIVLVMQRMHPDDLASRLQAAGEFKVICLPLVAEQPQTFDIGGVPWVRPASHVLDTGHYGEGGVEALRRRIPAFVWLSQYQQAPVGAGEGVLEERHFTPYEILPNLPFETYLSFDLAGGGLGETNSYSACAVVHRYNHNLYISQIWRGRLDYEALKAKAIELINQHPQARVLVEDAALGVALISSLQSIGVRLVRIPKPSQSKLDRLLSVFEVFAERRVHLPVHEPWRRAFIEEALQFPNGPHDDQVDTVVQLLRWFKEGKNSPPANFCLGGVAPTRLPGSAALRQSPRQVAPNRMPRPGYGPLRGRPRW
ncbi:phage terminase large subunit [Phenylobacterium sp.]|uniref:phage terminase large subunit n=1 Tax=Phenylobacterium sp. TaxID=1871053 RepID=UPI0035AE4A5E